MRTITDPLTIKWNNMRVYLIIFMLFLSTPLLISCSATPINSEGLAAAEIYDQGHAALRKKSYLEAIEFFDDLQVQYPFGDYAQQGELEKAYAHFKLREFDNTDEVISRFIRVYPRHPHIEYAYYLRALARYTQGVGLRGKLFKVKKESRTAIHAQQAFQYFNTLIKRFPNTRYRADSVKRMKILRNHMAEHELHIARFYMQRKAYVAAANRAKYLLETYSESAQIPETLTILTEAYQAMELNELAEDSQKILKLNFPERTDL